MPTYSFTRTREQVAAKVLRKLGVIHPSETPAPEDSAIVNEALDLRLKELHGLGILWWQVAGGATDVALSSGVATATISATDYLFPITMAVRVGTDDRPLEIIDHLTYQAIETKAETGEPQRVYFNGTTARFWPVPDANCTAKLTYEAIAADGEAGATPDVRTECLRALTTLLAGDLIDEFNTPEPKASRLIGEASGALKTIRTLNAQRVDSVAVSTDWF